MGKQLIGIMAVIRGGVSSLVRRGSAAGCSAGCQGSARAHPARLGHGSPARVRVISASVLAADGARCCQTWVLGCLWVAGVFSRIRHVCSSLERPWARRRGVQVMLFVFKEVPHSKGH